MNIYIKAIDIENGIIEGLGIPYGGSLTNEYGQKCDLEGEYFDSNTDFTSEIYDGKAIIGEFPVLYHHGLDPMLGKSVIGHVLEISETEKGKWFKIQLDKAHEYYRYLLSLAQVGALTLSSGAKSARKAADGRIIRWPLKEISITPSAMNPDAQLAKSLLKENVPLKKSPAFTIQDSNVESVLESAISKPLPVDVQEPVIETTQEIQDVPFEDVKKETKKVEKVPFEEPKTSDETVTINQTDSKSDNLVPANDKDALIRNLSTIADALTSVLTKLGASGVDSFVPPKIPNNLSPDIPHVEEPPTLESPEFEELPEVSVIEDNECNPEIEAIKQDIQDIKHQIGYDQKARKAINSLKENTSSEIVALQQDIKSIFTRLTNLETQSSETLKPVMRVNNPRINQQTSNDKAYESVMTDNALSEITKAELARHFALADIDDLLTGYDPKY